MVDDTETRGDFSIFLSFFPFLDLAHVCYTLWTSFKLPRLFSKVDSLQGSIRPTANDFLHESKRRCFFFFFS